jgi:hypothetical protein
MYFYFSITHFGVNYTKEKIYYVEEKLISLFDRYYKQTNVMKNQVNEKTNCFQFKDQTPQLHPKIVHLNDKRK